MSNEISSPQEFGSNPSGKEAVREALEAVTIGPEMMHAFAKETMQGAELVGTNLTLDVRRRKTNPNKFSYDYYAIVEEDNDTSDSDGPNHEGFAIIYAATEGVRPMIAGQEDDSDAGAVNAIVRQVLKNHRKGMASIHLKKGDPPVEAKAGKLSGSESGLLDVAEQAVIDYLLQRIAGPTDIASSDAAHSVAEWVGGVAEEAEGRAIISDIADRMAPLLAQVVELEKQEN